MRARMQNVREEAHALFELNLGWAGRSTTDERCGVGVKLQHGESHGVMSAIAEDADTTHGRAERFKERSGPEHWHQWHDVSAQLRVEQRNFPQQQRLSPIAPLLAHRQPLILVLLASCVASFLRRTCLECPQAPSEYVVPARSWLDQCTVEFVLDADTLGREGKGRACRPSPSGRHDHPSSPL